MRLLWILTASLGLLALPVQAQQRPSDAQVAAMVEALRRAAPNTGTANDGYYSEWQVKPGIIGSWSKRCIGRELTATQFENSPATARSIVACITRRELNSQLPATGNNETAAARRVACWWMTGNYAGCNTGATATYAQKVVGFYQQLRSLPPASNQRQPAPTSPSPSPSPSPSTP